MFLILNVSKYHITVIKISRVRSTESVRRKNRLSAPPIDTFALSRRGCVKQRRNLHRRAAARSRSPHSPPPGRDLGKSRAITDLRGPICLRRVETAAPSVSSGQFSGGRSLARVRSRDALRSPCARCAESTCLPPVGKTSRANREIRKSGSPRIRKRSALATRNSLARYRLTPHRSPLSRRGAADGLLIFAPRYA